MFILYSLSRQKGYMIQGDRDIALTELQLAKQDEPNGMWILGFS